ncbi:universal stress protein [Psychromonas sp.]|uniref:universal stress protein n=1 Tax=Psychromonas sp. TaxID=1884585 RepID=UPI00356759B8
MSYKHILVAVDLSESSKAVIDKAVSLAKDDNCKLSFVFVDVDKVAPVRKEDLILQNKLQTLAEQSGYPITETLFVIGDLHIKLAAIVKEMDIDLVVCGHHHKFLSRLFSTVPKIINAVTTDILIVCLENNDG